MYDVARIIRVFEICHRRGPDPFNCCQLQVYKTGLIYLAPCLACANQQPLITLNDLFLILLTMNTFMTFLAFMLSLFALVSAAPIARDVWAPHILTPKAGTVWTAGHTYEVTW